MAHAHAGAINLMTGDLAEAEGRFECQLEEAQKAKTGRKPIAHHYVLCLSVRLLETRAI